MLKKRMYGLACVMFLVACAPQDAESNQKTQQETAAEKSLRMNHGVRNIPPERMLRSQVSPHYRVSYQPVTDPVPLNTHFRLRVNVQDLKSSRPPEPPIALTADADMPEHNHGMQVAPEVQYLGKGQYEVRGMLFHMAGYWELKLALKPPAGDAETVIFGIQMDEKPTPENHEGH